MTDQEKTETPAAEDSRDPSNTPIQELTEPLDPSDEEHVRKAVAAEEDSGASS